jgi:hypothetical protein
MRERMCGFSVTADIDKALVLIDHFTTVNMSMFYFELRE